MPDETRIPLANFTFCVKLNYVAAVKHITGHVVAGIRLL